MKKINILKKNEDFDRIIKNNKPFKTKYFIIYLEWNNENIYHFGLSVGKKIGNAVTRNKYKRRIKDIIDEKDYKNNFNCIIILRKEVLNLSFEEFKNFLLDSFEKIKITKENLWKRKKYL